MYNIVFQTSLHNILFIETDGVLKEESYNPSLFNKTTKPLAGSCIVQQIMSLGISLTCFKSTTL